MSRKFNKFHVEPLTGVVQECRLPTDRCPFGGFDHHFHDPGDARDAWSRRQVEFRDWLARSSMPHEDGWVIEHVFDPERRETYHNHLVWLDDHNNGISKGTRMVIENGWVFTKLPYGHFWELVEGVEVPGGIKKGIPLSYYQFIAALDEHGGRMEFREGVVPMKIRWNWEAVVRPVCKNDPVLAAQARAKETLAQQQAWEEERADEERVAAEPQKRRSWWRR